MKNKHVLFLTPFFYPHVGGVEKHVYQISILLVRKGFSVSVVTVKHNKNLKAYEEVKGIKIYRIPYFPSNKLAKYKIWPWFVKYRNLFHSSDIIHCHDVFFRYLPFRLLLPQKKVYTTFHGYESYPVSQKAIIIRKISEKLSFGNICIGRFIEKWYGTKADYISYGGVNIVQSSKLKVKSDNALFIGRLDEQTGIKTYVDAIELIRKKVPNFKLTVIGDGKFKNQIIKQVNLIGWKKNPEKYFSSHRFAFVSRYLSILEAMAAKRLVFAVHDNPIKKDYLKMSPFAKNSIITSSPQELADKVEFYIKHPSAEKKLIEKGYAWVSKQTWERVTDTYVRLWSK